MKTNNIIKTILIPAAMGTLFASCSLDYEPLSQASELTQGSYKDSTTLVLKDKAAAEAQLQTLLKIPHDRQEHRHLDLILVGDVTADNAYGGSLDGGVVDFENNSMDVDNANLERDWNRYLEDIGKCNVLIIGSKQLYDKGSLTESEYNNYRSQGELCRALQMFPMVRIFGGIPIITTIGPTITSENIDSVWKDYYPARNTIEECYDQIVKDLEDAAKYAPDFNPSDRTLLTKPVAYAFLAKAYAEMASLYPDKKTEYYNKVIEAAEKVRKTQGIDLEPEFKTLWGFDESTQDCVKRNTSEGILEAQWVKGGGNWESWMFTKPLDNPTEQWTWAKWITPSRDLIKFYEDEGDTERFNQTVVFYPCEWSLYYPANNYPFMHKLRAKVCNEYVCRLADIILLEAEAYAYTGNLAKSAELVNMIRQRAKLKDLTADQTSSQKNMIDAVLKERRLELALEGERWFDLKRNGKVEEVMNGIDKRDSGRHTQVRPFSKDSYLMPIPQTAIDQNDNLVQNPGY